jgi:ribosomal protein S14
MLRLWISNDGAKRELLQSAILKRRDERGVNGFAPAPSNPRRLTSAAACGKGFAMTRHFRICRIIIICS